MDVLEAQMFSPYLRRARAAGWLAAQDAAGMVGPYRIRVHYALFDVHQSTVIFTAAGPEPLDIRLLHARPAEALVLPDGTTLIRLRALGTHIRGEAGGESLRVFAASFPPLPGRELDIGDPTAAQGEDRGSRLSWRGPGNLVLPLQVRRPLAGAAPVPGDPERLDAADDGLRWEDVELLLGVIGTIVRFTVWPPPPSRRRDVAPQPDQPPLQVTARSARSDAWFVMRRSKGLRSGLLRDARGSHFEFLYEEPVPPATGEVEVSIAPAGLPGFFGKPVRWRWRCTPATT